MKFNRVILGVILVGIASGVYANVIDDGIPRTVTNHVDEGYQLTVGEQTSGNSLNIVNGGSIFDGVGMVGELSGSDNNSVLVSGSGSSWTNTADLVIGNAGSFNTLVVADGGYIQNANGQIGVESGSVNNIVVLSGSNTVWNNTDTLRVGVAGDSNTLIVQDGAVLQSRYGAIGFDPLAANNDVIITGSGSVWSNSGELVIGELGNTGNALTINNGGTVVVGGQLDFQNIPFNDLYLEDGGTLRIEGHSDLTTSGFNYEKGSTLEVAGSVWFDGFLQDDLTLVFDGVNANWLGTDFDNWLNLVGSSNRVVFTNGVQEGVSVVDVGTFGDHNRVLLTGDSSLLRVTAKNSFGVGNLGSYNEFRVENGASVVIGAEGFGYIGQGYSDTNGSPTVVVTSNRLVVEGDGSTFSSDSPMIIGLNGVSNGITVLSGGAANFSGAVSLGVSSNSHSNIIVIDGMNSRFNTGALIVGDDSKSNTFTVQNGAQAESSSASIGVSTNGHNNQVIVSGEGSFWNAGTLSIGESAASNSNNSLTIQNEGMVTVSGITISTNGVGNELNLKETGWLTVAGEMDASMVGFNWASNSTLEAQGVLKNMSPSNNLYVYAGVTNGLDRYEYLDGSRRLMLSGGGEWDSTADSVLTDLGLDPEESWVTGYTTVGYEDASNQFHVVGGGKAGASYGMVGDLATSDNNLVVISGAGSMWSNNVKFVLGEYGAENSLVVTNGGLLWSWGRVYIGNGAGSDGNEVLVDGAGSLLHAHGRLSLGDYGSSNTLSITDGATVESISAYVGRNSNGNQVLIADAGSSWSNSSDLYVGYNGSENNFMVTNGGVSSVAGSLYVGTRFGADSNRVSITGPDSRWVTTVNSHVGRQGDGNELRILDGAQMYDDIGLLGTDDGSDGNYAVIDGTNSLWYHRHTFFAGNSGSSNRVMVSNSARLMNTTGYIGYHENAKGNEVVIDDATWENSANLFVGFNGSGNTLIITNGASVSNGVSFIGAEGDANDNGVLVTGSGSIWTIGETLQIGNSTNSGNSLTIEDGGRVVILRDAGVAGSNVLDVNEGGLLTVYGYTTFSSQFNVNSGGTLESYGGVGGLGGVLEGGRTLKLLGSGSWDSPESILVETGATLDIGSRARVETPSNYVQQAGATIRFGMATNTFGTAQTGQLIVGQVADFASGANFMYSSEIGNLSFDATYTNVLVDANTLIVGGQTNATTADLKTYLNTPGSLVGVTLVSENNDIKAIINRISLSDGVYSDNEDLLAVLDEIDNRASAGEALANTQLGIINGLTSATALGQLEQFYTRGTPNYMHAEGMLQGLHQIGKRTSEMLMETAYYSKPGGVYGPASSDDWRGWISAYGNLGSYDSGGSLSGYDAAVYGSVIGVDRSFEKLLVGLAGGLAGTSINQDDGDTSDASSAYGVLYSTAFIKDVEWDLMASYGSSSIDSKSGTLFGSDATIDASTAAFYLGASEEAAFEGVTLTTLAALQVVNYSQSAYTEESNNAIGRDVDAYDRWSYQSILGLTVGTCKPMTKFDLLARVKASWQHEFNADADTLNYTLIGGTDPHHFTIQAPVEDSIDLGINFGFLFKETFELSLGLDGRFAQEYMGVSYNGKVQYSF